MSDTEGVLSGYFSSTLVLPTGKASPLFMSVMLISIS